MPIKEPKGGWETLAGRRVVADKDLEWGDPPSSVPQGAIGKIINDGYLIGGIIPVIWEEYESDGYYCFELRTTSKNVLSLLLATTPPSEPRLPRLVYLMENLAK